MHPAIEQHRYPVVERATSPRFFAQVGAHIGLVRDRMEDAWCAAPECRPGVDAFGVFDGLGGLMHGQAAAWAAADRLPFAARGRIDDVLAELNRGVRATGGTTTAVIAVSSGAAGRLDIAAIGDSSAWRLDAAGGPERVLGLDLDAEGNPTACLGFADLRPRAASIDLAPGASLLLCTDGVDGAVPREALAAALRDGGDPGAIERLLAAVLAHGGPDNAVAILVHRPRAA